MRTRRRLPDDQNAPAGLLPGPASEMLAPHELPSGMSPMQMVTIVRSHWKKALAICLVLVVIAYVGIKYFVPRGFDATAMLVIDRSATESLASHNPNAADIRANANYMDTQRQLILSPVVLLPVVDQLGLYKNSKFLAAFKGSPEALRQYIAQQLAKSVQVTAGQGGEVLTIQASSSSPDEAAKIANAVAAEYLVAVKQRAQHYADQLSQLSDKVATAQAAVSNYRQQHGISALTDGTGNATDTDAQALTDLEGRLLQAQNQRRTIEAQLATGAVSDPNSATANPQISQLRTNLNNLEQQYAQLRAVYGPKHPKMLAIEAQVAAAQRALNNQEALDRRTLTKQLADAKILQARYSHAVHQQRAALLALRSMQGQGARLELNLQSAQQVYRNALDAYDQVLFAAVGTRLFSRALPPAFASKPNKKELAVLAVLFALAAGILLPFGYELYVDRRVRCRDDLERGFGIRVLAQFDPIKPASDRA